MQETNSNHDNGATGIETKHNVDTSLNTSSSNSQNEVAARIGLNDNKAGMEGLDKEKINKIIIQASKGSKFYENELKKDKSVMQRINSLKKQLSTATETQLAACRHKADMLLESLKKEYDFSKYIVHMDMDAFYAAVEMRDNPKLRDVPMAVGGEGMLSTSNYLARRFGVRAAMPGFIARKLCPNLVIVPLHFKKYIAVSKLVRNILSKYDPTFSAASLDEAYIDFTEHMNSRITIPDEARTFPLYSETHCCCEPSSRTDYDIQTPEDFSDSSSDENEERKHINRDKELDSVQQDKKHIYDSELCSLCHKPVNPDRRTFGLDVEEAVHEMRHRIHLKTQLTASAGIACNCMLAKICSDKNKPNGQYRLEPTASAIQEFMKDLPIRKVPGIGKVSEKQLTAFGIRTCQDFYTQREKLCFLFSDTSFDYFMAITLGQGSNWVGRSDEGPKSKSVERTFRDKSDPADLLALCHKLSLDLSEDLKRSELKGKTVTLKIKLVTFEVKTRAQSLTHITNDAEEIFKVASSLLKTEMKLCAPNLLHLRLMGVRMSNFSADDAKQSRLKVKSRRRSPSRSEVGNQVKEPSFFDTIDAADLVRKSPSEREPLGLLAYMSSADRASMNNPNSAKKNKNVNGINRYSVKRKNIWDDIESLPLEKQPKPGTKGAVTICSLLATDSDNDPWKGVDDIPLASTPHTKSKKGPLGPFQQQSCINPWVAEDSNTEGYISKASVSSKKAKTSGQIPEGCGKNVKSYFTKTKSVWDNSLTDDEDVVCLSNPTSSKSSSKGSRRLGQLSNKKTAANHERVSQPICSLVDMFSSASNGSSRRAKCKKVTNEKLTSGVDVVTIIDSD